MNLQQPNLTERHKELAMTALQKEVNALVDQQQAMEPGYTEKRLFFEDIKQEFEALDSQMNYLSDCIRANQDAINVLKGLTLRPDEEIIIVSSKKKSNPKRVDWLKEVVRVLKREGKPLLFEELWPLLENDAIIIEAYTGAGSPLRHAKMAVLSNINKHINNPRQEHYKQLYLYQRKFFGLPEWFDEKGSIKAIEHARNFAKVKKLA